MTNREMKLIEIKKNYARFLKIRESLERNGKDNFVIMRHGSIVEYCQTLLDANLKAKSMFDDGIFSIQEIDPEPVELGYFSYANDYRVA